MKTVAIHQPNFMPWMGFFQKMYESDIFVLFDDTQFTKGSYINRTKVQVKGRTENQWLTIPVHYHSLQKINEVEISSFGDFRKTVQSILYSSYPKSYELLSPIFSRYYRNLCDLNIDLIYEIKKKLNITTEIVRSSTLNYEPGKTHALVDIVRQLGGTEYLSGSGGSTKYLDDEQFRKYQINVRFADYSTLYPGTVLKYIENENN